MPPSFAPLPRPPASQTWSGDLQQGYQNLSQIYNSAVRILQLDESDAHRLNAHANLVEDHGLPLLAAMAQGLPDDWIEDRHHDLKILLNDLRMAETSAKGIEKASIRSVNPVQIQKTGRRGRPRKIIPSDFLADAFAKHRNISVAAVAKAIGVSRDLITRHRAQMGIRRNFDPLSNADLDKLIREVKEERPDLGLKYVWSHLRSSRVKVQRERVRKSMKRVDGVGVALRAQKAIRRRKYTISRPNALWHADGYHKLIPWGIVIHGIADGFCRTVLRLLVADNNKASTTFKAFREARKKYGTPSRVRGDRGGENIKVAIWMILRRGPRRGSYMWGSSTHNVRIERLWVEVATYFARRWRAFFMRLERIHRLDRKNTHHLWLLHILFLHEIQNDANQFAEDWNHHPIRGESTNEKSPADLRFLGELQHGVYNSFENVDPDILQRYHGVEGERQKRSRKRTGAGHPDDENSDSEWEDESQHNSANSESLPDSLLSRSFLASNSGSGSFSTHIVRNIHKSIQPNIRHAPVAVPRHQDPFRNRPNAAEHAFFQVLRETLSSEDGVPAGYSLEPSDWEDGQYPEIEHLPVGRRRQALAIHLPQNIWLPRAIAWAKALDLLNTSLALDESNSDLSSVAS